jgi:drug/metabolite transporter (DMT)-like permease
LDPDVDYATTLLAAVLIGIGFVLQQCTAWQEPESRFLSPRILTDLLRKPRWLLGIAAMVCGQLLAAWSIGHLELTLVEPLLTTNLVFALFLAVPMAKQAFRWSEVAGAVILCAGVALLSLSRSTTPIGLSFGSFSHWWVAAVIAGIAFVAVQAGHRRKGPWRAILTGLGAGLVFGIQDALTRQTLEILQGNSFTVLFSSWEPYCLLGAGIVGLWLMQNAFSAGPLHASLPAISAGEPVAGMVLGIVVFGDRVQISPGQLAIQAGGIAALIVGVVMVARSSAFAGLRKITDAILPGHEGADTAHARPAEGSAEGPPARPGLRDSPAVRPGLRKRPTARPGLQPPASGGDGLPTAIPGRPQPFGGRPQPLGPAGPRLSIRSSAALTPPSAATIRRTVTIIAGRAQKSPQTHRMAAPICWSAYGGSVTPGTCS